MFGVILAVGPGNREVQRMHDTLGMVACHEDPAGCHLVLIDDDPHPRDLDPGWPNQRVLRTTLRRRRDPYSAMTAATVTGLTACRDSGVDVAVKLDTDVAVIAPFSDQLRGATAEDGIGVVGSYDRTSTGSVRDWSAWEETLARADRALSVTRGADGRRILWHRRRAQRTAIRRLRSLAATHAPVGAHCLGGAYAVSRAFLERAELDWRPWVGTGLSEDVVVGILCAAAGLQLRSMVGPGEPFALAWQGLPSSPEEIVAGRHSIVHSVKAPTLDEERRMRIRLTSLAQAAAPPGSGRSVGSGDRFTLRREERR